MTAKFEGARTYAVPKERIFHACIDAMQLSGFMITASDPQSGSISAVSPDSQYSSRPDSGFLEEIGLIIADLAGLLSKFKERISVRIADDGSVHAISVSEPRTIRLDHGRNRQHVLWLWGALDAALGPEGASVKITIDDGVTMTRGAGSRQDAGPRWASPGTESGVAGHADLTAVPAGSVSDAHAFISYIREDSGQVDTVQRALEAAGVRVWRDTSELWPGEDWRARIRDAITRNALVFIACFSRHGVARDKSYQYEELALAIGELRLRRPDVPWLIPVRFDDCAIPDYDIGAGRTLTSLQRADLFGDSRDEAASQLIKAVLRILGPERAAPQSADLPTGNHPLGQAG